MPSDERRDDKRAGETAGTRNGATSSRFEVICCAANLAAGAWGLVYPRPYAFCITVLILLPLLSIPARRRIRGGNALAYSALGPIVALGMRAFFDIEFPALVSLAALSFAIAAAFVGLVFLDDRGAWGRYGLVLIFAPSFYGFGSAAAGDVLLDGSVTKFPGVEILSRDYRTGRNSRFDLVLAPWDDRDRPNKNSVSWYTYLSLRDESTVCIDRGPGALGIAWYRIAACPSRP